jgi:hypothetical protein
MSAFEAVFSTAAGFGISLAAAPVVYPLFGHSFTMAQNVGITIVFTFISLARGYAVRRVFNLLQNLKARHDNHARH